MTIKFFKTTISKMVFLCAFVAFAMVSQPAHSQIGFDDDIDDETPLPIDGLLGLGLAAGAWYGIKKIKGKK